MNPQTQCERKKCIWMALAAGVILAILPGCATTGQVKEERIDKTQNVFGYDAADIENAATFISTNLGDKPIFTDPKLQPYIIVEYPKVETRRFMSLFDDAKLFSRRLTTQLMKVRFRQAKILSREDYPRLEQERKLIESGTVTSSDDANQGSQLKSADFFLFSTIGETTQNTADGRAVVYLMYSFRLVDRRTSENVWQDDYVVKRSIKTPKAYQ
jgi:PBP1b-binding outer membrane lipoprotein LpoB